MSEFPSGDEWLYRMAADGDRGAQLEWLRRQARQTRTPSFPPTADWNDPMPNLSREDMDPGPPSEGFPKYDLEAHNPADALGDEPLSIDAIKSAIIQRANDASHALNDLRKHRDSFNAEVKRTRADIEAKIKTAVSELAEAKRIANALTPRKPRTKKAAK